MSNALVQRQALRGITRGVAPRGPCCPFVSQRLHSATAARSSQSISESDSGISLENVPPVDIAPQTGEQTLPYGGKPNLPRNDYFVLLDTFTTSKSKKSSNSLEVWAKRCIIRKGKHLRTNAGLNRRGIRAMAEEAGFVQIPRTWLRDHCGCEKCIHPVTKQRQFDTFGSHDSLPLDRRFQIKKRDYHGRDLSIIWEDGHKSIYSSEWLQSSFNPVSVHMKRSGSTTPWWWDRVNVRTEPPKVQFTDIMGSEEGVASLTRLIRHLGFCFVENCPETPEATKAVLERIGPIRNTHYGGFYDFTSDLSSKDTAYTSIALDVHTDNTYFTEPAGLQMFHLLSHTDGDGGETQLVDGFRTALELRTQHDAHFRILRDMKFFPHASGNDGICIHPSKAVSVFDVDPILNDVVQVRWNNSDRGAFIMDGRKGLNPLNHWYDAAFTWSKILHQDDKAWRYEFKLKPGMPLIFDNWRVLHGRSAFTGNRRMAGGYINRDDFISRFRTSSFGYENVLKNCTP